VSGRNAPRVASWREGVRTKKIYAGSCRKMSQADALAKARMMKAEALGIRDKVTELDQTFSPQTFS